MSPLEMIDVTPPEAKNLLCTVAQFKARYGFSGTDDDAAIESVIAGASARIAAECGRDLADADRTIEFSVAEFDVRSLWLPAWPVSVVTSVKEDFDGDWDGATDLTEGEDFRCDSRLGRVLYLGGMWLQGDNVIQVRWTGGYTLPGDAVAANFSAWATGTAYAADNRVIYLGRYYRCVTAHTGAALFATDLDAGRWREVFLLPDDLVEAAIQQSMLVWSRRANIGLSGGSAGSGGSFSAADTPEDLLPGVKATCSRYRRVM